MDEALKAVADATRRAILRLVRGGEQPAGEIAAHFPHMSRPAVSQHLRVLTDAGLFYLPKERTRGSTGGGAEGLRDAASFLEEMWSEHLARLKVAADREDGPTHTRTRWRAWGTKGEDVSQPDPDHDGVVEQTLRIATASADRVAVLDRARAHPRLVGRPRPRSTRGRAGRVFGIDLAEGGTIRGQIFSSRGRAL